MSTTKKNTPPGCIKPMKFEQLIRLMAFMPEGESAIMARKLAEELGYHITTNVGVIVDE
jgi:hypothetical protein